MIKCKDCGNKAKFIMEYSTKWRWAGWDKTGDAHHFGIRFDWNHRAICMKCQSRNIEGDYQGDPPKIIHKEKSVIEISTIKDSEGQFKCPKCQDCFNDNDFWYYCNITVEGREYFEEGDFDEIPIPDWYEEPAGIIEKSLVCANCDSANILYSDPMPEKDY